MIEFLAAHNFSDEEIDMVLLAERGYTNAKLAKHFGWTEEKVEKLMDDVADLTDPSDENNPWLY